MLVRGECSRQGADVIGLGGLTKMLLRSLPQANETPILRTQTRRRYSPSTGRMVDDGGARVELGLVSEIAQTAKVLVQRYRSGFLRRQEKTSCRFRRCLSNRILDKLHCHADKAR